MHYSFSTVLMAVLSSNLIIVFTAVCFRNKDLLVSFGYKMFALLLGLTFLRFVLPFEFPFATNLVFPELFSQAVSFLRYPFYQSEHVRISIWGIFEAVWIIGALVMLARFLKENLAFNHRVVWESINVTEDEHYSCLLDEICGDSPNPFCVFELSGLKVPLLYGIRRPRILIPTGMKLPEEELRFLLSHETAHHFHHDIFIKLGINLLAIVYWWNPACHALKRQLDTVLEMRVDDYVTEDTFESRQGYLRCLIHVLEEQTKQGRKHIRVPGSSIALINPKHFDALEYRFNMISGNPKPYARFLHVSALVLTVSVYLFSYAFIFEARYLAPQEKVMTFDSLGSYTYLIRTGDDTYAVYYGTLMLDIVDSIDKYPEGTPVYNSLEEVPLELQVDVFGGDEKIK